MSLSFKTSLSARPFLLETLLNENKPEDETQFHMNALTLGHVLTCAESKGILEMAYSDIQLGHPIMPRKQLLVFSVTPFKIVDQN